MKKTIEELNAIRERMQHAVQMRADNANNVRVVVGMATCGIAAGARPVLSAFVDEVNRRQLKNITVSQTGCIGVCRLEPIVEIYEPGREKVTYVKVDESKARQIVAEHLVNRRVIDEYTIGAAK
jgi:NADP-reducing hydrogenase subunit HndB